MIDSTRFRTQMLGGLPAERADDTESAIDIVRRRFTDHALHATDGHVRLAIRSGKLEGLGLHVVGYGAPVRVVASPLVRTTLVCFPVQGAATIRYSGAEWESHPARAAVLSPDRPFEFSWHDSSPQVVLSVPDEQLHHVASNIFGTESTPTRLPPTIDLGTSAGRALVSSLNAVHEDVNAGTAFTLPPELRRNLADCLVARLIAAATEQGDRPRHTTMSSPGKLVAAFVELADAAASEALTASAAAARLSVPLRTLQEHTHRELELTPGEVLARARLLRAQRLLRLADPTTTTVTAIALQCGFRHTGRFAQTYRAAFGEKPSTTLASR